MSYNSALDLMALSATKLHEGKPKLAAGLLLKAIKDPSFESAIAAIEKANNNAYVAAAKAAKMKEKRKMKASEEDEQLQRFVDDAQDEIEDTEDAVEDLEDAVDEDESMEETAAAKFARTLSTLQKKKARR
jgi:uncharacterized protein YlxW (UPF0749 family)